jgi:RHS repeat-associated protein
VTTSYAYDAGHRLTQKSYSDGSTSTANFAYDVATGWGNPSVNQANVVGRLSEEWTATSGGTVNSASVFGYDPTGRITANNQCTPQNCGTGNWPLSYGYDLAGNITSATNAVGTTFNYAYNTAARLTRMSSSLNDSNHPPTLISGVQYGPFGSVSDTLGNGVVENVGYSSRGLLASQTASFPSAASGGSVSVGGAEQSKQVVAQAAIAGTASFSITGSERTTSVATQVCRPTPPRGVILCTTQTTTVSDSGTVGVTVNGFSASVSYASSSTTSTIASALASALNASGSPVTASASGSTVTMTATALGASTNYSWSSTSATNTSHFSGTSFPLSSASGALSGGQDATYRTAYDSGTVTLTINGTPYNQSYSSSDTVSTIASGLAGTVNAGTLVSASASGGTITLVAKTAGASTDYPVSCSVSYDSADFSSASFSPGCPAALNGGSNTTPFYSYTLAQAADGQITSANDSANGNWTYSYDQFNRLVGSNKNSGQTAFTYAYDRYGNRVQQNVTAGQGGAPQYIFDNSNHIVGSGVTYDALGNVTNDGFHAYFYDAENRLIQVDGTLGTCSSATACYVYDAEGRRVSGPSLEYVYDLGGNAVTQLNLSGGLMYGEIYAVGRHLGTYSNGTTNFYHGDWLGTKRVVTGVNGAVSQTCTGFIFADGMNCSGTNSTLSSFTDDIHDPETNLEHTLFRQYNGTEGRWLAPDPSASSMHLGNPQSLNRYAYVLNNPANATDPDGLDCFGFCGIDPFPPESFGPPEFLSFFPVHGFNFAPGEFQIPIHGLLQTIQELLGRLPWNSSCGALSDCGGLTGFQGQIQAIPSYQDTSFLHLSPYAYCQAVPSMLRGGPVSFLPGCPGNPVFDAGKNQPSVRAADPPRQTCLNMGRDGTTETYCDDGSPVYPPDPGPDLGTRIYCGFFGDAELGGPMHLPEGVFPTNVDGVTGGPAGRAGLPSGGYPNRAFVNSPNNKALVRSYNGRVETGNTMGNAAGLIANMAACGQQ